MIIAFLVLLLLHNVLALPLLVRRKKPVAYALAALALLAAFAVYVLLASGIHGGPPPDGPGGPGGPGPIPPEVLMILVAFLLMAVNTGIVYRMQASRSASRIRELETEIQRQNAAAQTPEAARFLVLRSEGKEVRVDPAQIRYIEGMSEYVKIWQEGEAQPLVVLERLKNLENTLPAGSFLRIHRSYIVNLARIRISGRDGVTLDDGTSLPVGDSYRPAFKAYLNGTK